MQLSGAYFSGRVPRVIEPAGLEAVERFGLHRSHASRHHGAKLLAVVGQGAGRHRTPTFMGTVSGGAWPHGRRSTKPQMLSANIVRRI